MVRHGPPIDLDESICCWIELIHTTHSRHGSLQNTQTVGNGRPISQSSSSLINWSLISTISSNYLVGTSGIRNMQRITSQDIYRYTKNTHDPLAVHENFLKHDPARTHYWRTNGGTLHVLRLTKNRRPATNIAIISLIRNYWVDNLFRLVMKTIGYVLLTWPSPYT